MSKSCDGCVFFFLFVFVLGDGNPAYYYDCEDHSGYLDYLAEYEIGDYRGKYGIVEGKSQKSDKKPPVINEEKAEYVTEKRATPTSKGFFCANCKKRITEKVARFCFNNKGRFGGRAYCFDCQKEI